MLNTLNQIPEFTIFAIFVSCLLCGAVGKYLGFTKTLFLLVIAGIVIGLFIMYQGDEASEDLMKYEVREYAMSSLGDTPFTYKELVGIKKESEDSYTAAIKVDTNRPENPWQEDKNDDEVRILFINIRKHDYDPTRYTYVWDDKSQVLLHAIEYAKESLKNTSLVYKGVIGVKKESEDFYTAAVKIQDDRTLFLEIKNYGDSSFLKWDTASAIVVGAAKITKEIDKLFQNPTEADK